MRTEEKGRGVRAHIRTGTYEFTGLVTKEKDQKQKCVKKKKGELT